MTVQLPSLSRQELAALIDERGLQRFLSSHVFDRVPWIFEDDRGAFYEWRGLVSAAARVSAKFVFLVGSAATGYSLNPLKPGRAFRRQRDALGDASDLDVAIVDSPLFHALWDGIVAADVGHNLGLNETAYQSLRTKVYYGAIVTRWVPRRLDAFKRVLAARSATTKHAKLRGFGTSVWIYRRPVDLYAYQEYSLGKLRRGLAS